MTIGLAALALVITLGLRGLLPSAQRHRGRVPVVVLLLAVVLAGAAAGADALALEDLRRLLEQVAAGCLAVGAVGMVGLIVFDLLLARLGVTVPAILRDLVEGATALVVLLVFLRMAGVNVIGLVTTSAVLTAVIGLALQNTIADVFGGLELQADRTFAQGDWIGFSDHVGRIVEIGWRATELVTKDGVTILVPNGKLVSAEVLNFSRPSGAVRVTSQIGLHYRHLPNDVRRVLIEAVREVPGVLAHPGPDCFPAEFADSAIVYSVRYWIGDFERDVVIAGEVRTRLYYAARRAGLEIPFPIRTLVRPAQELVRADLRADRLALVAGVDVFRPLDDADRARLADGMRSMEFARGEAIIQQGDPGDSLFLIERGEVGVHLTADGSSREVATLRTGEFFGEMSLMTGEPRTATCIARTEVTCLMIDRSTFREVIAAKPAIAEELSAVLTARQAALSAEAENLTATARLRRTVEQQPHLLSRIQDFLRLGRA